MGIRGSEQHKKLWSNKNGPMPNIGYYNSKVRFIWRCIRCDHEWEGTAQSITRRKTLLCRGCISKESGAFPCQHDNKKIDCLGKTYGGWEVLKESGGSQRGMAYLCRCKCGNTRTIQSHHLRSKGISSKCFKCHTLERQCGIPISREYWSNVVDGAKSRGIEFDLEIADSYALFQKQGGFCALTGVPLKLFQSTVKFIHERSGTENAASLDRIDSGKGYVIDNVQWVRKDINMLKGSFSQDSFIEMCQEVSDYKIKKVLSDEIK